MSCDGCCQDCGAGAPCPACSVAVRVVTPAVLRELVAEMRAGGVGVLRVGSLEIDLTRGPAAVHTTIPAPAGGEEDETPADVLYRAGAGKRVALPFGGRRP